jgi:pimeloyl-ACP methyl ester carboxylesterase
VDPDPGPGSNQAGSIVSSWGAGSAAVSLRPRYRRQGKTGTTLPDGLLGTTRHLIDIIKMGLDPFFSTRHLWNDKLYQVNLFEQVPRLEIPLYFFAGRHDYFTPSEIVEEYFHTVNAPQGKELIWFENSGHEPESNEPEKFCDVMVNRVLKATPLQTLRTPIPLP